MKRDRQEVYDKMQWHCWYCWKKILIKEMQVDHIISQCNFEWDIKSNYFAPQFLKHLTVNDVHHIDNLMPSCRRCNNYKSSMTLEKFRKELERQIERLNLYSTWYKLAKAYWKIIENNTPIIFYFEF